MSNWLQGYMKISLLISIEGNVYKLHSIRSIVTLHHLDYNHFLTIHESQTTNNQLAHLSTNSCAAMSLKHPYMTLQICYTLLMLVCTHWFIFHLPMCFIYNAHFMLNVNNTFVGVTIYHTYFGNIIHILPPSLKYVLWFA
jgi:hypothetical protein